MINYRTYPAIMVASVLAITYSVSIVFSILWPEICWLPRIGGSLVGVAVVVQGYVEVNEKKFCAPWRWELSRKQFYLHFANTSAVIGTIIWTFGDLFPQILWFPNTPCTG
ncbi:hypothetical protein QLQ85_03395 [Halomonas sp. M4R5S39]|uniref:hypothetical protein n=1 Tax=Halomonas kalidii TaxID=3043293 RepID=UPI0024A91CC9|nr:hypothetical protein [Halomonas kalidii]MDI5983824.1 hypothetical protein [Halomonas kalidii]